MWSSAGVPRTRADRNTNAPQSVQHGLRVETKPPSYGRGRTPFAIQGSGVRDIRFAHPADGFDPARSEMRADSLAREGAIHPKVLLRESVGGSLVIDDWDELLPDCPNENCLAGMVDWRSSRQPAGGEDVSWGHCDSCGTFAFTCRDCGEVDSAELGTAECFTCGAKYELESVDYQSTEIGEVIQVSRGED